MTGEPAPGETATAAGERADRPVPAPVDIFRVEELTLRQALTLLWRLNLKSWIAICVTVTAVVAAAFAAGHAYRAGEYPEFVYSLDPDMQAERRRMERDAAAAAFAKDFSRLMQSDTLLPLARSVARHRPDGLESEAEIVAALVHQLRAGRGRAMFFTGDDALELIVHATPESLEFEWVEKTSLIPRILMDVRLPSDEAMVLNVNRDMNTKQFFMTRDGTREVVIYVSPEGSLSAQISE